MKIGQQVQAASEPYCKLDSNLDLPNAGPASEQYALDFCIYFIRFGHTPFPELDAPSRIQKMSAGEYPATDADYVLGQSIQDCWLGRYDSMADVKQDIPSVLGSPPVSHQSEIEQDNADGILGESDYDRLLEDCKAFLAKEEANLEQRHDTDRTG